jgi:hypothetical protein
MMAIILVMLAVVALKTTERLSILLVDAIATGMAAWYCWRIARVSEMLLASRVASVTNETMTVGRAERRLMSRHLRLSIAMTAHHSLFPPSSMRGNAIIKALAC